MTLAEANKFRCIAHRTSDCPRPTNRPAIRPRITSKHELETLGLVHLEDLNLQVQNSIITEHLNFLSRFPGWNDAMRHLVSFPLGVNGPLARFRDYEFAPASAPYETVITFNSDRLGKHLTTHDILFQLHKNVATGHWAPSRNPISATVFHENVHARFFHDVLIGLDPSSMIEMLMSRAIGLPYRRDHHPSSVENEVAAQIGIYASSGSNLRRDGRTSDLAKDAFMEMVAEGVTAWRIFGQEAPPTAHAAAFPFLALATMSSYSATIDAMYQRWRTGNDIGQASKHIRTELERRLVKTISSDAIIGTRPYETALWSGQPGRNNKPNVSQSRAKSNWDRLVNDGKLAL